MNRNQIVSLIGAVMLVCAAAAFIGCDTAAGSTGGGTHNSGTPSTQSNSSTPNTPSTPANPSTPSNPGSENGSENQHNNTNGLVITATGTADRDLKGSYWNGIGNDGMHWCRFAESGNIAEFNGEAALYVIEEKKLSFDLTEYCEKWQKLSLDSYIAISKKWMNEFIAETKLLVQTTASDSEKERFKKQLKEYQERLEKLEHPTEADKAAFNDERIIMQTRTKAIMPYAKFQGMFNPEKTQFTIEKYPEYNWEKAEVELKTITFEKR